jgi:photosystem I subunit 3
MRRVFSLVLSIFLILGFAPTAQAAKGAVLNRDRPNTTFQAGGGADVAGLTPCSESPRFQERANAASTPKDIARFKMYSKAACGDDGLPHLIMDGRWNHAGDLFIPMVAFIYIAGIIGWSGRTYLIESQKVKNPWDNEIHIDFNLAKKCVIRAAAWPALADKEWRNGNLLKADEDITLNGPR